MKVFVFGWYDHGNIGDESYKLSFTSIWPEHNFIFGEKFSETDFDLCIIGGGDVIRENSLKVISKLNCPKIAVSVTVTAQSLCEEIHLLEHIYVRDHRSYETLIEFGYNKVTYIPDISIILQGNKVNGKKMITELFQKNNSELYENVYTIVVNAHLLGNPRTINKAKMAFDKMITDISELADKTNASFLFLPFSTRFPWDDRVTNGLTNSYSKFYKKNCVVYDKLSVEESVDIIAASKLLITTRFHGLIFGVGNNIPTITISFHDKISGFCETIDQSYMDYYNFTVKELEDQINTTKLNPININQIKQSYLEKVYLLRK